MQDLFRKRAKVKFSSVCPFQPKDAPPPRPHENDLWISYGSVTGREFPNDEVQG